MSAPASDDVTRKRVTKTLLSLGAGLVMFFLCRGLPDNQAHVAGVFTTVVCLWIMEVYPLAVTALFAPALLVLVGQVEGKAAFAPFGNEILFLFVGSFTLAKAFEIHGLHERVAQWLLNRKAVTKSPASLLLGVGGLCLSLSLFISNTAVTIMMLPIALRLLQRIGQDSAKSALGPAMMLMLTWGASFAVGTPVSTPPNLIGLGLIQEATKVEIGFGQWMLFAMPISITMLVLGWIVLRIMFLRNPDLKKLDLSQAGGPVEPLTAGGKAVLGIFFLTLTLWICPDLFKLTLGEDHILSQIFGKNFTPSAVALVAMILCYALPAYEAEGGRVLTWKAGKEISWSTVMLFGGGLAMGKAMFDSGLAATLGQSLVKITGANTVFAIMIISVLAVVFVSELASNTAAVSTLVPVVIGICQAADVNPLAPALAATIAGSLGFMLPVSTAPNAIVYSSGLVSSRQMMKSGVVVDVIGILVVIGVLWLILPMMGLV
jgi:sodium-dependent dicarboxylate transporter 2/3/5